MTESEVNVSNYNCGFVCFSFLFYQLLAPVLWNCVYIHDCYVFSVNWILYHYVLPFTFGKNPHSEVYFCDMNSASLSFICFRIRRYKYFHPFNFKLLTYLRWEYFFTKHNMIWQTRALFIYLASWAFAAASGLLPSCSVWASLVVAQGLSCIMACGFLAPRPGIKPVPLHWKADP